MKQNPKKEKRIFLLSLLGRGGTYHTTVQFSSALTKYYDTYALIPSYSNTKDISKKVNLMKINAPPNTLKTIFLSLNIFRHIKTICQINSCNPDIIDIMDIHPWYILYWPFLRANKKVVTINDPELHSGEGGIITKFILRTITRFLLKRADSIIVLGKKQEDIVRKSGYRQKIIVSRLGHYGFLAKKKSQVKLEPKTILFFGRIRDYKGLSYLLDALIELKVESKEKKEFKLMIVGDGDLTSYASQLKKLGDQVEIYNKFIADDEIAPYFERASFIVLPYTDATQTGIVPVAYSFKKAVIATTVGSLPEVVINEKTGIIVPPKNSRLLGKAILSLLKNSAKAKTMGNNGYQFMKKELDWDTIVKKLLKELEP